jgi:AraC family transcriptional regulator
LEAGVLNYWVPVCTGSEAGAEPRTPTPNFSGASALNVQSQQVRIVDFAATRVAILEHRGDPRLLGESVRKFIAWRRQNNLPPSVSATFNIVHDTPIDGNPDDYLFDLCAATEGGVAPNSFGVIPKIIPGGRCAVLRHLGSDDTLGDTVTYLYADWLLSSGQELRDFPMFFQRVRFPPEVAAHEAITDVFLPIR